jgi:hypothetical protein
MPWREPVKEPVETVNTSVLTARVTREVWKRAVLWIIILVQSVILVIGWKDYQYMDTQIRLMRANYIEDVVGYDYCDTGE